VKIALLCATARGERFLRELAPLARGAELHVATFREEPWEPPFADAIGRAAAEAGAAFSVRGEEDVFGGGPFDLLLAVNWRFYTGRALRERAAKGAWVFHDSLLPEYRGFSPTVWAIVNGEDHTGVTLLEMSENIDEGAIADQRRIAIAEGDTIASVMERVTEAYVEVLRANFGALCSGGVTLRPQDESRATYACKRLPDDNRIDWSAPSRRVLDLVRGVTRPYPGAWTALDGERLTVWSASADPSGGRYAGRVPGRIVALEPPTVLTGDGAVVLHEIEGSIRFRMSSTLR
jgi:methionyl-tRNA formyltransferase